MRCILSARNILEGKTETRVIGSVGFGALLDPVHDMNHSTIILDRSWKSAFDEFELQFKICGYLLGQGCRQWQEAGKFVLARNNGVLAPCRQFLFEKDKL